MEVPMVMTKVMAEAGLKEAEVWLVNMEVEMQLLEKLVVFALEFSHISAEFLICKITGFVVK